MIVIPAIDLKGGRCVRLMQGRADAETVYADDPVAMAKQWEAEGAAYLHLVDLDGAFEGRPMHAEVVSQIAAALNIPVELGGGLRKDVHVRAMLDCGVDRVILGTRALEEPGALQALVDTYGRRIVVGIDARDGFVQVKGWVETSTVGALELARQMDAIGVDTIIYTDTSTDGMMRGHNVAATKAMCDAVRCNVVASGGVTSVADIEALAGLEHPRLSGAIVGKALYEGAVTLADLLLASGERTDVDAP
ncbi:MAG: 1-(5-phosphoribosyl)-5-[(5-phosphoribosylamino)methylideneamino]imidazole-4-carboxamide isomerase [Kiritimatiellia bacterium]|jgi:phosphoribosylformimino-5-aminoimidazole carboxamide ribotide isomerase|nr:1-(5-phosphoribosyl)-5-[(5-phosphoribosylamino)methylideneamino]imidazole-4-carboxamide isomerase [Kiritimatiellia bacterium]MDP6631112.1 1-(5-phosphoribosyl)-5-[(5-phosphoribosylamino)methylideneamino]imidazole-4-carboxamide isomerase [Kiritimatiellia bacterium]MDP6810069.1 1-(5-phosphoribosyl)-5-[(5-phosphoribosylamino)methylideneamino]imidazole-4-carboxamide isomerase [Kiritimatiellia bacterium]MDP7024840.1 1-(5-phosphoribosyl)-5-[(5-phosphoribosylamino)methylideneamino]imidazole-4-carboxa